VLRRIRRFLISTPFYGAPLRCVARVILTILPRNRLGCNRLLPMVLTPRDSPPPAVTRHSYGATRSPPPICRAMTTTATTRSRRFAVSAVSLPRASLSPRNTVTHRASRCLALCHSSLCTSANDAYRPRLPCSPPLCHVRADLTALLPAQLPPPPILSYQHDLPSVTSLPLNHPLLHRFITPFSHDYISARATVAAAARLPY